jgi:hypothetical protein
MAVPEPHYFGGAESETATPSTQDPGPKLQLRLLALITTPGGPKEHF